MFKQDNQPSQQYIIQKLLQTHLHRDISPSTNSELIALLTQKIVSAKQPQLLTADCQTNGRGQHGRTWHSPKGNLFLSLYYPLEQKSFPFFQPLSGLLSLVIAYQIIQLPIIEHLNHHYKKHNLDPIGIKWANDIGIYPNQLNANHIQPPILQKLAGILIEPVTINDQKIKGIVIGIGLNVMYAPKMNLNNPIEYLTYQSTSLQQLIGNISDDLGVKLALPTAHELYQPICQCLIQAIFYYNQIQKNPHLLTQFQYQFNQAHLFTNQKVMISQTQPQINHMGQVIGINKQGALQIKTDDGKVTDFYTGTIRPID